MTKVIIDRKRWIRGEDDSYLLRDIDKKMCCLGFACLALGLSEKDIYNKPEPADIDSDTQLLDGVLFNFNGIEAHQLEAVDDLIFVNDDEAITDKNREDKIIELGKEIGLEFVFIN